LQQFLDPLRGGGEIGPTGPPVLGFHGECRATQGEYGANSLAQAFDVT
jgi:hypothetical protein